jgi:biopolymer transport protein TolR
MGGPAKPSSRPKQQPSPHINVTPLVDVVLVLLIIFMVVTPALSEGEHVELPAIMNVDKKKDVEPLDVTLALNGIVVFDKDRIEIGELRDRLTAAYAEDPERRLLLKADSALPYVEVREAFALAQEIGYQGISLKVIERKPAT